MGWLSTSGPCDGVIVFPGDAQPRAEDFAFLQRQGFVVKRVKAPAETRWAIFLQRDDCGKALLHCNDAPAVPPGDWIECDARLSDTEKRRALEGRSSVRLTLDGSGEPIIRHKKRFLRFLRAVLGGQGVVAADVGAMRLWSPAALDDELSHDADLDIDALYTLHVIGDDAGTRPLWLHTHGLAEIGAFDFDILEPSEDLFTTAVDMIRALAYAAAEGEATIGGPTWNLADPGGTVRFVDAGEFMTKADPRYRAMRSRDDDDDNRAVVCEPLGTMGRLFGGKPAPSKFLSSGFDGEGLIHFSESATKLMAQRARGTFGMFRRLVDEFAEFGFNAVAKISYEIDGGGSDELEHLWFEVHGFGDDHLDATLQSEPFHIARMKRGQRGKHPLKRLADWVIVTPAGMINPRDTAPARMIRERREELLEMKRRHEGGGGDTGPIPFDE